MIKIDPIIAVKDVEVSSKWYEHVFGVKRLHGESGSFAVLGSDHGEIILCLHGWGEHHHPSMTDPGITPGNGLMLYFRTSDMQDIRQRVADMGVVVDQDVHLNPNSLKKEFSLRDPDGYYLTITEYHEYKE
jgi:catechol 2,3-dioxygenase-like lactoylglutathione lyase family enzyme